MSKFKQTSFSGGMNLLLDDTRLPVSFKYKEGDTPYDITYNQYRLGINIRTRFDIVTPINSSVQDKTAPSGIKQGLITFGNYLILFVAGKAFYRLGTQLSQWQLLPNFQMSTTAPRVWTCQVPQNTTLYGRLAGVGKATAASITTADAQLPIIQVNIADSSTLFGTAAGIVVQDGITQPWFIYIDSNGMLTSRPTQNYNAWAFPIDTAHMTATGKDAREYVPIGTYMEWAFNGKLMIVDPTFTYIFQSVFGRPLDFVINVDLNGQKAGDATTTAYSVGTAGITAMKALGTALFVAAGGAQTYFVTLNQTQNAPQIFGEYTFNRQVLFNANCLTEQGIVSISGGLGGGQPDTLFIDANGIRSFNAVQTLLNEGRNSVFSSTIQNLFNGITQNAVQNTSSSPIGWCSAVNFNDFAIFSVNTVYGYVLVVYDTINNCYQSIDVDQLGNHAAKQFAAITVTTLALWCITDDDRVMQLYAAKTFDNAAIRFGSVCNQDPTKELKLDKFRAIYDNITQDSSFTASVFTNNRYDASRTMNLSYVPPTNTYTGSKYNFGTDIGPQTNPILFAFPDATNGWKAFVVLQWSNGANLNSVSVETIDSNPMQSPRTQAVLKP